MNQKLKVLFLDHFNRHGGAQEYILDLAGAMEDLGVDAFVCESNIPSLQAMRGGFKGTGFRLLSRSYRNPAFYLRFLINVFQIRRLVNREGIDVIHCNSIPVLLLARIAGSQAKIVATCHDFLWHPAKVWILRLCPDRIIAVSESVRAFLISKGIPGSHCIIHNGFRDECPKSPLSRAEGPVRVGLVARLVPWKGCELILDAVEILCQQGIVVEVRLIGEFENQTYEKKIQNRLSGLPVTCWSFIGSKPAIYQALDIVVNASIEPEPFGRTLVEAGMFWLPAIGPREGGPAEIILNGTTGLTYTSGNARELASAMGRLIQSEVIRNSMGRNARLRYLESFTLAGIAAKVVHEAYQ